MLWPVARTWSAVRIPGTEGSQVAERGALADRPSSGPVPGGSSRSRLALATLSGCRMCLLGLRGLGRPRGLAVVVVGTGAGAVIAGVLVPGRVAAGPGGDGRLGRVDHDALADEGVQRAVGQAHARRALHDLPDQQPVVGAGQRVV